MNKKPAPQRAAIVGLGQVGLLFDQDVRRSGVWTHFTAYERLPEYFDLVAVCDPDPARTALARERQPFLRVYADMGEMLDRETLDIVSLCTPPALHASQIRRCAGRVRAVICEKPLSLAAEEAECAVSACEAAGTWLAVNYYKRFAACVPAARRALVEGRVGRVKIVNALFCGPLDAVGSHMLDLLRFLLCEITPVSRPAVAGNCWSLSFRSVDGALVQVQNAGAREEFVFECDILGDAGRLRLLNNGSDLEQYRYHDSPNYSGYRELRLEVLPHESPSERFLPIFIETAEVLAGQRSALTSDGANALRTQRLIDAVDALLSHE